MTAKRDEMLAKIWRGHDPYLGFQAALYRPEEGGWGSTHPYLAQSVLMVRPHIVVEIGVWNGLSTRMLANTVRELDLDAVVFSVDTWLGSVEHWLGDHFAHLRFVNGYPTKQKTFLTNIVEWGLTQHVLPVPLDSLNAAGVLASHGIVADVIHLDAAHEYESVAADLRVWWPILRPGGILIGDDYHEGGAWPGVKRAIDEFRTQKQVASFEHREGKCLIVKGHD